jgi:tRNA(Ile)-lysidine synthase
MRLAERVLDTIRRHALLREGERVLVALSGGSDSVALLRLLRELEPSGGFAVAAVAHVNHRLRESADRDEQFSRGLADGLGVPFLSECADVRALAAAQGTSLETAGRRARYEALERMAAATGASAIATGHTRDDQAETFLLRLLRGAGPKGLGGIHPRAGSVVRPLLDVGRQELRDYLSAAGQPYCDDESNEDVTIPRNRIRHELLPLLEARFSPGIAGILAREAAIARDDDERLQEEAIDLARSIVLRTEAEESVQVDVRQLSSLHPALAGRVARIAMGIVAPGRFVGQEHVERVLALAASRMARGALSLPGQHVERQGGRLVLSRRSITPFQNSFRVSLSIPGEVVLPAQGWAVSASLADASLSRLSEPAARSARLAVSAAGWQSPLTVRSRERGDRYRPAGLGGRSRKLQDILVDRKIARDRRDSLPLVVDGSGRIVWIVGEPVAEDFRVTAPSQAVIFLKARRLGGQG